MAAAVLWSGGAGYAVSAPAPGPVPTIITVPATLVPSGTFASLFVLLTSATPGSGLSAYANHAYSVTFTATGTLVPLDLAFTIGQNFPSQGDPLGYGTFAFFITDISVMLGGELTVTVNVGADSLGLADSGSVAVCVIDPDVPQNYEPWWIALVAGGTNLPPSTSVSFQMPSELGPFLSLMTLSMVGASTGQLAATDDLAVTPATFWVEDANGTTTALASYVSPYPDLTPLVYPVRPDADPLAPVMHGSWSWTTATNLYSAMMFWLGPRPAVALTNKLWLWGGGPFGVAAPGINAPVEIRVVDQPNSRFVKVVPYGAQPIGSGNIRWTTLTNAGEVYARRWGDGIGEGNYRLSFRHDPLVELVGPGDPSALVPGLPQGTIVDIDTSFEATFALDNLGQLWAWSTPTDGYFDIAAPATTVPFVTLTGVAYFKAGPRYCIAQRTDGSWWGVGGFANDASGLSLYDHAGVRADDGTWIAAIGSVWTESPEMDALDTVKVVTGAHGVLSQLSFTTLLIQRDGTVWQIGGFDSVLFGPARNITGINWADYYHFEGSTLVVDAAVHYPIQIPWASNIVDAAIAEGRWALYLTATGVVYYVFGPGAGIGGNPNVQFAQEQPGGTFSYATAPPPTLTFPPGVIATALYPGAGAVIGSDGLLYTIGATPTGELLSGTDFAYLATLSPPQISGMPNDLGVFNVAARNGLTHAIVGGYSQYGFLTLALSDDHVVTGAGGGGGFGGAVATRGRGFAQVVG